MARRAGVEYAAGLVYIYGVGVSCSGSPLYTRYMCVPWCVRIYVPLVVRVRVCVSKAVSNFSAPRNRRPWACGGMGLFSRVRVVARREPGPRHRLFFHFCPQKPHACRGDSIVLVIYILGVYAYGSKAPEPGWPSLQTS